MCAMFLGADAQETWHMLALLPQTHLFLLFCFSPFLAKNAIHSLSPQLRYF